MNDNDDDDKAKISNAQLTGKKIHKGEHGDNATAYCNSPKK